MIDNNRYRKRFTREVTLISDDKTQVDRFHVKSSEIQISIVVIVPFGIDYDKIETAFRIKVNSIWETFGS